MKSGELLVEADQIDQISEEELSTLILTQEFILYALERDDWLLQFLKTSSLSAKSFGKINKPDLTLIKGGLDD